MRDESFLQAIIERPDDDAIRLVYADWLEEHNQPERAEFIRVQIERARLPEDHARQAGLFARELRLLAEHGAEWRAGPPILKSARFRRGFIEYVEGNAEELAEQMLDAFQHAPLRDMCVAGWSSSEGLVTLSDLPELARIGSIRVAEWDPATGEENLQAEFEAMLSDAPEFGALLGSRHLRNVTALSLSAVLSRVHLQDILRHKSLSGLRKLRLGVGLSADGIASELAEIPDLPLESLQVDPGLDCRHSLSMQGLQRLVNSGHWRRLRSLDVGVSPSNHQWLRFGEALELSNLRTLRLREGEGTGVGVASFLSLTDASSWGHLESLGLDGIYLGSDGTDHLLAHAGLRQLRHLEMVDCGQESEDVSRVFTCPELAGLRRLNLNTVCHDDILAGPEASPMAGLIELGLHVTNRAALAIGQSPHLHNVRLLSVGTERDECLRSIAGSVHLPALTWLQLQCYGHAKAEPATTQALTHNPALANLAGIHWTGATWFRDNLAPLLQLPWLVLRSDETGNLPAKEEYAKLLHRFGGPFPPLDEIRERE
jgi:uncharacterized protein (TIGR02996 family)